MRFFGFGKSTPFIRPMTRADAAACAAIHASSFAHPWSERGINDVLASDAAFGDVAADTKSARLRGFILSRLAADEAEILTIAVERSWRRHGLGRALLARNMSRAAGAGARHMFLEVDEENAAAVGLYARFGFLTVGRREGYYRSASAGKATARIMRAPLS